MIRTGTAHLLCLLFFKGANSNVSNQYINAQMHTRNSNYMYHACVGIRLHQGLVKVVFIANQQRFCQACFLSTRNIAGNNAQHFFPCC